MVENIYVQSVSNYRCIKLTCTKSDSISLTAMFKIFNFAAEINTFTDWLDKQFWSRKIDFTSMAKLYRFFCCCFFVFLLFLLDHIGYSHVKQQIYVYLGTWLFTGQWLAVITESKVSHV